MNPMISNIKQYMSHPDATDFWIEADGNEIFASRVSEDIWNANIRYWNGKEKKLIASASNLMERLQNYVWFDEYTVYSCTVTPTRWTIPQIRKFMDALTLDLCDPNFFGFTLSAENAPAYHVHKTPNSFHMWRINNTAADLVDVILQTESKLQENVYWKYTAF